MAIPTMPICRQPKPCRKHRRPDPAAVCRVWTRRLACQRASRFRIASGAARRANPEPRPSTSSPQRDQEAIAMFRVLNKRKSGIPAGAVYIGCCSKWGNPFRIGPDGAARPSLQNMSDGCAISTNCCRHSTNCTSTTSSASAHRSHAMAISCCGSPTHPANTGSRGGAAKSAIGHGGAARPYVPEISAGVTPSASPGFERESWAGTGLSRRGRESAPRLDPSPALSRLSP